MYPKNRKNKPVDERFWSKVNKTDTCWLWTNCALPSGHGQFRFNGKTQLSHRVSWILHFGAIPDNIFVCHHCDVPACVRPDHLFLGTQADNMHDMISKGRESHCGSRGNSPFGENHHNAKLTEQQVLQILDLRNQGFSYYEIANIFDVFPQYIGEICRGETWTHIDRPPATFTDCLRILNDAKVTEILQRLKQGERQCNLAREFGVHAATIQSIVAGKSWNHIARP